MRISHVITRLVVGGAQENTITSVLGLREKPGFDLRLISGPSPGPEGSMEPIVSAVPGLLTVIPELVRPIHPWKDWIALRRLTTLFQETRPDIVHTHSGKAGILGRMAAARACVPIIIHHIHGPSFGPFQGHFANAVFTAAERYAARFTHHFLCTAHAMTRLYLNAGIGTPSMYTRVPSGFPVEQFTQAADAADLRQQYGLTRDHFVIGALSRIAPLKGHPDLLRAFQSLLAQVPNARLLVVGDGTLRNEIEAATHRLGISRAVTFTGLVKPAEVPRHLTLMNCVAHLSYREALSRALPQALAAGKPVIAYDFDGADEICLDGQTGFLVRMGDVATVTDRLLRLAREPSLRYELGRRGQELVRESFTVERMIETQAEVYRTLAKARGINSP
jgi:glycosyltransferase involved in cell wall biosynthesis